MTEQEQPKNDFMHKLALQIVERRNLVFLIVILGAVFTIFSRSWANSLSRFVCSCSASRISRYRSVIISQTLSQLTPYCRCAWQR